MFPRKYLPSQQNVDALHHLCILDADTEFGETADGCSTDNRILQDDSVVDIPYEFRGIAGLRSLEAEQVKDSNRQFGKLAVLNKFTQVGEG